MSKLNLKISSKTKTSADLSFKLLMKRSILSFILSILVLTGIFCGKRGPIYPPLVKVPQTIEDLKVFQRGDAIVLQWSNPTSYVNGNPIEGDILIEVWLLKVEKKLGEQQGALTEDNFASKALLFETIKQEDFAKYQVPGGNSSEGLEYVYKLSPEELSRMVFVFGLKVKDRKNKESSFSSLTPVLPSPVPLPPLELRAVMQENSVVIEWQPPEKNVDQTTPPNVVGYNVYRKSEDEEFHQINTVLIEGTQFVDSNFLYNVTYRYTVRASATKSSPFLESENSEVAEVLTQDTLVPAAPTGLVAIAGESLISLSWDANKEIDLAGYRVWRKSDREDAFTALTELIPENVYHDSKVEKNTIYHYAITALDEFGNESQKSKVISVNLGRDEL
jgi:predicted small lipoprotein YifL